MKRFFAAVLAGVMILNLSACGGKGKEKSSDPSDLSGQWKQVNSESEDSYQGAIIQDDVIEIYWVSNGGDTRSLYWSGTFEEPDNAEGSYSWESEKNEARTKNSLMASGDDTKTFTYEDGQITYSSSIYGSTTKVRLEKEEWEPGLEIKKEDSSDEPSDDTDKSTEPEELTYFPFTTGGIEFSIPSYYESVDIEDTGDISWFDAYNGDRLVIRLGFLSQDVPPLTQEGFEEYCTSVLDGMKNSSESEIEMLSSDTKDNLWAGFLGKTIIADYTVKGVILRQHMTFAYSDYNSQFIMVIMTSYINQADNYIADYNKMIESAKLVESEQPVESSTPANGIRHEFKEAMDSYEEFFDEYVAFMKKYTESGYSLDMLSDYAKFMSQYTEMMEAMDALGEEDMSTEEAAYYLEVTTRINQKLLDSVT